MHTHPHTHTRTPQRYIHPLSPHTLPRRDRLQPQPADPLDLPARSPGQVAGVAEPALPLRVGVAAVLAGAEPAVQALPLGGREEPVGLQAAGAVGVVRVGRVRKQLPPGAFLLDLALQSPALEMSIANGLFLQQALNVHNCVHIHTHTHTRLSRMQRTVTQSQAKAHRQPSRSAAPALPQPFHRGETRRLGSNRCHLGGLELQDVIVTEVKLHLNISVTVRSYAFFPGIMPIYFFHC